MYTLVFNNQIDGIVVFNVYYTRRGKCWKIGNIFCYRNETGYLVKGLIAKAMITQSAISQKVIEKLYDNAKNICKNMINK